jgi:hypothetical protein
VLDPLACRPRRVITRIREASQQVNDAQSAPAHEVARVRSGATTTSDKQLHEIIAGQTFRRSGAKIPPCSETGYPGRFTT